MATEDACKLFVAGLPDSVTEDVLREVFEAVGGTVVDVSLPRDRATGRPRGFGFVTFSTPEEAGNARQSLDGSLQAGRSISVRPFSSEPPRRGEGGPAGGPTGAPSEDRTLYVGNLPYDASQQEVIGFLGEHGVTAIARVHLPAGPDGRPRGFGFVTLQTADAANEAIISLRGVEVRGRRLLVNIAHPRGAAPAGGGGGRGMGAAPGGGGGWSGGGGGSGFSGPPPELPPPGSRPEGRRRGGTGGPTEGSEEDARRAKKKGPGAATAGKKGRAGAPPEKGGGGNWRSWNRDDDE